MPSTGFVTSAPVIERPQNYAIDPTATGIDFAIYFHDAEPTKSLLQKMSKYMKQGASGMLGLHLLNTESEECGRCLIE
jgi:hypothetical protein